MEHNRISTPPAANHVQGVRSKAPAHSSAAAGQAAEDPAAVGGFLSLLCALGDGAAVEDPLQAAPQLDGALPAVMFPGVETSLQTWQGMLAQPHPGLPPRSDGATTLSLAEVAQQAGWVGAELLGQGGLVAQTAKMDSAAESQAMPGQGSVLAGYQRAFSRLQGVLSQGAAQGVAGVAQTLGRSPELAGRQGVAVPMSIPAAAVAASERMEAAALPAPTWAEPVPTALQAQWLATAEQGARPAGALLPRESGTSAQALGGTSHGVPGEPRAEGDVAMFDPAAAGAEEAAAEQAAYWVSENLQNAELTVNHDGMPVEVRVSLSGNEAHVAFSSDESQTRELLDAQQDQLRDMLGNEGLVLSGVSVGDTGARNASGDGSAAPRGRPSGRIAVPVPEDGAVVRSRPSVLTDRAVDVFV